MAPQFIAPFLWKGAINCGEATTFPSVAKPLSPLERSEHNPSTQPAPSGEPLLFCGVSRHYHPLNPLNLLNLLNLGRAAASWRPPPPFEPFEPSEPFEPFPFAPRAAKGSLAFPFPFSYNKRYLPMKQVPFIVCEVDLCVPSHHRPGKRCTRRFLRPFPYLRASGLLPLPMASICIPWAFPSCILP